MKKHIITFIIAGVMFATPVFANDNKDDKSKSDIMIANDDDSSSNDQDK